MILLGGPSTHYGWTGPRKVSKVWAMTISSRRTETTDVRPANKPICKRRILIFLQIHRCSKLATSLICHVTVANLLQLHEPLFPPYVKKEMIRVLVSTELLSWHCNLFFDVTVCLTFLLLLLFISIFPLLQIMLCILHINGWMQLWLFFQGKFFEVEYWVQIYEYF